MNVVDRIRAHAEKQPDHPALVVGGDGEDTRVSYAELVATFDRHAGRLRAAGVASGDRCGLLARQGRGFVELALGILAADGCLAPIPDDHLGAALEAYVARCRLHHVVREGGDDFEFDRRKNVPAVDGEGDRAFRALQPAYLRFTSGTTSQRKGVILGHDAIVARLAAANRALEIGPEDRILWLLPMAHHFVVSILLYLSEGATVLLPAGTLARTVIELGSRAHATLLYASPHHIQLLAKDTSKTKLPQLRLAISTAEGIRREIAQRFAERFDVPVSQALGIIEVGLAAVNLHAPAEHPEAVGRPLPDYQVWLRGEDGAPVEGATSPERTGEVCIRGPGLLDAYLDPWLPAAQVLVPDGFRTGDQGWFDDRGALHLAGRRRNRISMAGMKFFCEEVEAVLDEHPGIRESRVLAREHAHLGEIPVAEIVAASEQAPPGRAELSAYCRERLPGYKVPREFRVVESLARTASGKIQRSLTPPPSSEA